MKPMFDNIPDNYDIWQAHQGRQDRKLDDLPKCARCEDPIQDDFFYEINGENICEDCLQREFRRAVDVA